MALSQALESQLQLLREALTSERSSGEVRFSVTALGEEETDLEALDARATQQEFRPLADSWRPLSLSEAEALLGRVLHLELAYSGEALAAERVQELAARFCDLFGPEGRFFSNAPGYRLDPEIAARCREAEERLLAGGIETETADALHERGVRFHEAIVGASGNPFFLETIRRINRLRRLLSYRSMLDRSRYYQQCREQLAILDLIERGRMDEAAQVLERHLGGTLVNIQRIRPILER